MPPRSSHNLIPSPQCTPFGISGPKWPLVSKIPVPRPLGGLGSLGGLRGALTTSPPRPNVPPLAFPAAHGPFCLKFNCRARLEPLEASEELSQPHPLAPMYPLYDGQDDNGIAAAADGDDDLWSTASATTITMKIGSGSFQAVFWRAPRPAMPRGTRRASKVRLSPSVPVAATATGCAAHRKRPRPSRRPKRC